MYVLTRADAPLMGSVLMWTDTDTTVVVHLRTAHRQHRCASTRVEKVSLQQAQAKHHSRTQKRTYHAPHLSILITFVCNLCNTQNMYSRGGSALRPAQTALFDTVQAALLDTAQYSSTHRSQHSSTQQAVLFDVFDASPSFKSICVVYAARLDANMCWTRTQIIPLHASATQKWSFPSCPRPSVKLVSVYTLADCFTHSTV